jgi:hypothetical protein
MSVTNFCRLAVGLCTVGIAAFLFAAPPAGGYHLLKTIPLGAAPGGGKYFDYITADAAARRVYSLTPRRSKWWMPIAAPCWARLPV